MSSGKIKKFFLAFFAGKGENRDMKNKCIIGRQFNYRKNAYRAIQNFKMKYVACIPLGVPLVVIKNSNGLYEIQEGE